MKLITFHIMVIKVVTIIFKVSINFIVDSNIFKLSLLFYQLHLKTSFLNLHLSMIILMVCIIIIIIIIIIIMAIIIIQVVYIMELIILLVIELLIMVVVKQLYFT